VGLDVHARSIVAAIDGVTGEVFKVRLTPDFRHVLRWVQDLAACTSSNAADAPPILR
jgi:hypothetical protein